MNKKKKITTTTTVTTTEEFIDIPTNEKTHIICILDRSGSMSNIINDSIGGFNGFLNKQKELPDEATLTVILFDNQYELIYDNVDIKLANEMTKDIWYPRGMTSMYDAIGKAINSEIGRFAKMGKDKPAKVLVCVVTDGYDNQSKEYNIESIKKLIKDCENDNWNFIYLAAGQDAFSVGDSFGISAGNTYSYAATAGGVANMSSTMTNASIKYRSMSSSDVNFSTLSKSLNVDDDDKNVCIGYPPNIKIDDKKSKC